MDGRTNIYEATVEHFLAPIRAFLEDVDVSEILINSPRDIYIEKAGKLIKTEAAFEDEEALLAAVNNVLQYTGKRLTHEHPLVDSRLPDGSRVHVVLADVCRGGTCVTIRKFTKAMFNADHLVELGTWTPEVLEYLRICVLAEKNLLVAGGTSTGKTCLLNVLSNFIPPQQRIVVIEDSAELELQQSHVIGLEGRPPDRWGRGQVTIADLFKSSLRLRPDRVIIGEVRGGEALDMIQAMTSGHAGSMSTLHADTALDALSRLETLAMMNKVELPLYALRAQIASAIDVIVMVARFNDGRRALTSVCEVLPLKEARYYEIQEMFRYELLDDKSGRGGLVWTGKPCVFRDEPKVRLLKDTWGLAERVFRSPAAEGAP